MINTDKLKESIVSSVLYEGVNPEYMFQKDMRYFYGNYNKNTLKFVQRKGKMGIFVDTKSGKTIEREILIMPKMGKMPAEEYIKIDDSNWVKAWFDKVPDKKSLMPNVPADPKSHRSFYN